MSTKFSRPIPKDSPSRKRLSEQRNAQGQVIKRAYKQRATMKANKASEVEIFSDEKNFYHLLLVTLTNNPVTKQYDRTEVVQTFSPEDYRQMNESGFFKKYDEVEILHDPSGEETEEPVTGTTDLTDDQKAEVAAAAEALADKRETYAILYGAPAAKDATIAQLDEWIESRRQQLVTDRVATVKGELTGMSADDLRAEYKKLKRKEAGTDWSDDDLIQAVALARVEKESKK